MSKEFLVSSFNNPVFSDWLIKISSLADSKFADLQSTDEQQTATGEEAADPDEKTLFVSAWVLSKDSEYFRRVQKANPYLLAVQWYFARAD